MKNVLLIAMLVLASGVCSPAQNPRSAEAIERQIRRLERAAAEAVLRQDFEAIDRLCAKDFTTTSPRNDIVRGREALKDLLRRGVIGYASFTREIETVLIFKNTAIVMGRETIVTKDAAGQTPQNQARRYTNVWIRRGGRWLLSARHASFVRV